MAACGDVPCAALAELLTDAMTAAALYEEAEALEEMIAKRAEVKRIEYAGSQTDKLCNAVMNKALGG